MARDYSNYYLPFNPDSILVNICGIGKQFSGVYANRAIDLELRAGEVHALLGENGAGKSTLMNILAGTYAPDEGNIFVQGELAYFQSPAQAIAAGIGMIHQHFRLVEKMTVAENIHLGWHQTPWNASVATLAKRVEALCNQFGMAVDPNAKIWQLSTGEQQRVEILRVLARGARVLILDEPTAVLTPNEVEELFQVLRTLVARGHAVVFISHKLEEVLQIADRVSVLRQGRKVTTCPIAGCSHDSLARLMVGQEVVRGQYLKEGKGGEVIATLSHVQALNDRRLPALVDLNLTLRSAEILGVAGVSGNGQRELAEVMTGLRSVEQGKITLAGNDITHASPGTIAVLGVGHIPQDRLKTGAVSHASVIHNAILRHYHLPPISRGWRLFNRNATKFAKRLVELADVRVPHLRAPFRHLSGGNQQKLVTRRELQVASLLLVAAYPNRGIDIGAVEEIQRLLVSHRNAGVSILLFSEDLDEILSLSDRIVVLCGGRIMGEFDAATASRAQIGLLMGGAVSAVY